MRQPNLKPEFQGNEIRYPIPVPTVGIPKLIFRIEQNIIFSLTISDPQIPENKIWEELKERLGAELIKYLSFEEYPKEGYVITFRRDMCYGEYEERYFTLEALLWKIIWG